MVDSYHDLEHAKTVRDWFGTYLVRFAGVFVLATHERKIVLKESSSADYADSLKDKKRPLAKEICVAND